MSEVIKHGETGWLTAADPKSLTKSILEIVANPQQIAEISHQLISNTNKYTFADVVSEYRKLFERLRKHQEYRAVTSRAATSVSASNELFAAFRRLRRGSFS